MEYLTAAGYFIGFLIASLIPPAVWFIGRRKFKSPLWTILLLHVSLVIWFLLARADRYGGVGYGDWANLVFTLYFLVYPFIMLGLAMIIVRSRVLLYACVVGIAAATGMIAFTANREAGWRTPQRKVPSHYRKQTPAESAGIAGGVTLALGLLMAAKRKDLKAGNGKGV